MKISFAQLVFFVAPAVIAPHSQAQEWKKARYDSVWIAITPSQIKMQLRQNQKDVVGAYQLWRRASYQGRSQDYFAELQRLQMEQPSNGRWLALRCAVIEESILYGHTSLLATLSQAERSYEVRRADLDKAEKMMPKLWLNFMTESNLISWKTGKTDISVLRQQVAFSRKAVQLAPDLSFPRKNLAGQLSNLSFYGKTSDAEAVHQYQLARRLAPRNFAPALGLTFHYRYNHPNAVERKKAEAQVLATIPPNIKLSAPLLKTLTSNGITPP